MLAGAADAGVTVNPAIVSEVPVGVFTDTLRVRGRCVKAFVVCASPAMVMDTGRLVAVPPPRTTPRTPVPLNTTDVAPDRLVPVIVAVTVVPWAPEFGTIELTVGGAAMLESNTCTADGKSVPLPTE